MTMTNKIIVRHRQNVEVRTQIAIISDEKKEPSLFDPDPSPYKNELNRSHSRGADYRLPPLIETPRGRRLTYQCSHFHALGVCFFFSFFFFLHLTNRLIFVRLTRSRNESVSLPLKISFGKMSLSIERKEKSFYFDCTYNSFNDN